MKRKMLRLRFAEEESGLDPLSQLTRAHIVDCGCGSEHQVPLIEPTIEVGEVTWRIECLFLSVDARVTALEAILKNADVSYG